MDKISFRKNALKKRSELFATAAEKEEADRLIFSNLMKSGILRNIRTVLTYVSYRHEADTLKIISGLLSEEMSIAVPKCGKNGAMDFFRINSMDELKPSSMGIPEPEYSTDRLVTDFSGALCIVPGTAFDRKGNRTGYGGGYYDRFLSAEKDILTAGLCYQALLYDEVPSEPHDERVDYIITEKGFIRINE